MKCLFKAQKNIYHTSRYQIHITLSNINEHLKYFSYKFIKPKKVPVNKSVP